MFRKKKRLLSVSVHFIPNFNNNSLLFPPMVFSGFKPHDDQSCVYVFSQSSFVSEIFIAKLVHSGIVVLGGLSLTLTTAAL